MMAIDFPNSPSTNATYTVSGRTWIYDGEKWGLQSVATNAVLDGMSDVTAPTPSSGDYLKYNGSAWVNDPINLTTDTVGDYVASLVAGTGITLSNNSGEGATPTVAVNLSGGTGVTVSGSTISIGQDVGTASNVTFNTITFPQNVTNKLRLYPISGGGYEIGIQAATMYYRVHSDGGWAWHVGGTHNDGQNNAGGGIVRAVLSNSGVFSTYGLDAGYSLADTVVSGRNGQYASLSDPQIFTNTSTLYGYGCNANHSGYRVITAMCGWSTARMAFHYSQDWNSYPTSAFTILPWSVYAWAFNQFSDARLKTDIEPMTNTLDAIKALEPKRFRMKVDEYLAPKRYGFIAQDVEEVLPDLVSLQQVKEGGDGERLTLDTNGLVAVSIKALQELIAKVEELERKVNGN